MEIKIKVSRIFWACTIINELCINLRRSWTVLMVITLFIYLFIIFIFSMMLLKINMIANYGSCTVVPEVYIYLFILIEVLKLLHHFMLDSVAAVLIHVIFQVYFNQRNWLGVLRCHESFSEFVIFVYKSMIDN